MIGTITRILAKAGWKSMNGPLADERRRLAGAVAPAAYASYDPRLMAGAGWYGYRISFKGGDRSMLEAARYLLREQYVVREMYDQYTDNVYSLGVVLRQRVRLYGIGGGSAPAPEPDALNFYMPDGGTITLTRTGSPTVVELEYSIDGGATWQVWEEVGNVRSLTLAAGGKMYVRNTSEMSTEFSTSNISYYKFSLSDDAYGAGDLCSLLCKNPKNGVSSFSCFFSLFYNESHLLSSPDLLFDDVKMQQCQNMLRGTGIGEITLYSEVLKQDSYRAMLYDCRNLTKITTYMTNISATNCLYLWVNNAAPTGDFYCPAELTITTGASGIPAGWTRHDI